MTGKQDPKPYADATGVERALRVVEHMVRPNGCAWHADQTHESLTKFMVEEAYELVHSIEQGDHEEVAEELGDVLYQVLFHATIAARDGEGYDFDTIAEDLATKLIARHPHVFGDRGFMTVDELNAEWEHLKEEAEGDPRGSRGPLDGVPEGMSTLARAAKVVERLKRARLLDPKSESDGASAEASTEDEAELGDAMMRLVIRANAQNIDPERALRRATTRLINDVDRRVKE